MKPTHPWRTTLLALGVALLWAVFGRLRFEQGLDLTGTGLWVLGARLQAGGTAVHALVDTGDGPLRYVLLGAWIKAFGGGFGAAAGLLVLLHCLVAGLLARWTLRRGILAATLPGLALVAAAPLNFGALWAGLALLLPTILPAGPFRARATGVLLAGLFVTDALWFLLAGAILLAATGRTSLAVSGRRAAEGFAAGLAIVVLHALSTGAAPATLANAFAGPWSALASNPGPGQILGALRDGAWLDRPFAGLATGERLGPAWPAQGLLQATGLRLAGAVVLLGPIAWLIRRRPPLPVALAGAALVLTLGRGDLPTLQLALVPGLLAWTLAQDARAGLRVAMLAVGTLALLAPLAENLWLVGHSGRDTLVRWDDAGVRLGTGRRDGLQRALVQLHLPPEQPALIWPDLAGLHVLLDTRPAVRALAPVADPARDAAIARVLAGTDRTVVLFAPDPRLLPQNLERTMPSTAATLRQAYRLRGALPAGGLNLRAIAPGARPGDPLAAELPRIECMVAPEAQTLSPALRDDLAIGQSFRIEGDDLRGFAIRLVTAADSVEVELRARVWERPGSKYDSLLEARTLQLVARRDQPMHWVEFAVDDTAGRDLALLFECRGTPAAEVRFAWHEDAAGYGIGDVYRQGSAMLDFTPVAADLIMLIY